MLIRKGEEASLGLWTAILTDRSYLSDAEVHGRVI